MINDRKLQTATILSTTTDNSITEIAKYSGSNTENYFFFALRKNSIVPLCNIGKGIFILNI